MKQSAEGRRARRLCAVPVAAALALATAAPAAHAVAPVVGIDIKAGPKRVHGRLVTSMMRWRTTFGTDTPGAPPFTVQSAELFFPDHTYGRFFPSCSAAQIARYGGNVRRCPKGSQVGVGSLTALVVPAGVEAAGRVRLFNSDRGRGVTFNIQTTKPAVINESFDAPFTNLSGEYPMKLTMDVPAELEQVLPGLFVGLKTFDLTISGVIERHGKRHHYLPLVCPPHGLHADFDFLDPATGLTSTASTDADLDCHDLSS